MTNKYPAICFQCKKPIEVGKAEAERKAKEEKEAAKKLADSQKFKKWLEVNGVGEKSYKMTVMPVAVEDDFIVIDEIDRLTLYKRVAVLKKF